MRVTITLRIHDSLGKNYIYFMSLKINCISFRRVYDLCKNKEKIL